MFGCMCPCVAVCVCYRQLSTALMPLNSTVASAFNLRLNFQFAFTPFCRLRHKNPKPNRIVTRQWQLLSMCVCLLTAFAHFGLWECQAPTGSFFQQHRSKLLSSRRIVLFFMSGYPSAGILLASYFLVFFFRLQVEQTKILMHAGSFASDLCT